MKNLLQKHIKIYYLLIIIACCSFSATSIGITTNCMGLFVSPISQQLNLGYGSITLYITIMSLCSAFFAPILSILISKYDIRLLLSSGIILNAIVLFSFSTFHNIYLFYIFSILLGIGNCCFSLIPITLLIGNWFKKRHGLVSGICLSFSGITGALFNPIINQLITQIGWREAFIVCALLVITLSLPFALFIVRLHPRQVGLPPYGADTYFIKSEITLNKNNSTTFNYIVILVITYATIISFVTSFNSNMASFAASIPLSSQLGASMISAAMIANVISKILLGCICDKWNAKAANFIMIFITMLGCLGITQIQLDSSWFALLSTFFYGFVFASNAAGIPLLIKEVIGIDSYPKFYSICTVFTSCSYAIGVSLIGYSYDFFNSYHPVLILLIILCLFNLLTLIIIARQKERSILSQYE